MASPKRYIELTGSDNRMDCRDMFDDPLNPLPTKCDTCGVANFDHVPQPYYLVKSRTMSPNEMAPAENGNFLVRGRIRTVLEFLTPTDCDFFPTRYKGTTDETPWHLAVPTHDVETEKLKSSVPYCESCHFPLPPDHSRSLNWTAPTELLDKALSKNNSYTSRLVLVQFLDVLRDL